LDTKRSLVVGEGISIYVNTVRESVLRNVGFLS